MPFNGSGVFSRVYNWVNDRNNGIKITASRMDQEFDGIATGLSSALLKDGTQAATALIPFVKGINIASAAPASPQTGDLWIDANGLTMRFNGINIVIMPIGLEVAWGNDTPPAGWLLCAGQNVSRTTYAKLFSVLGTSSGAGDGSTTFGIPDKRGRAEFGKDNMGGSASNRITSAQSGITGTTLGAVGGDERMHTHTHAQNSHGHGVSDPTHAHSVFDPGHAHGYSDPGHAHVGAQLSATGGAAAGGDKSTYDRTNTITGGSATGITIAAAATGIGIFGAATGIGINATTAINQNAGAGASQNMPPAIIRNKIIFAGA